PGKRQSAALTGAYLSGLATGDLATNAGQPPRGAGLGKEVKAATQQAGQLAGALVGQSSAAQAAEAQTKGAEVQHALASDGSERTLEQLATSQGLAGLASQSGAAAGTGGESQSALGHTAATHGHSAQGASLGQTPPLADKSDRLPSALPTLSSFAMTANQADNAEQLGQRLTLMLGQKWHEAELQLEPEGLGKMRIQLKMDQEQQAQVHILVQHQQTKELVDQALPRLRDMLAGQGIQMSQAQVQQHSAGQQGMGAQGGQWGGQGQGSGQGAAAQDDASQSLEETVPQTLAIHSTGSAGIDFYA
ncbi:MAG: flagellar hook-length control protein FliK, partial [Aeromonadaceae bacterium]|nr:flagellar hook-length control protein FliK [Aeromonadaceae bacterium]